MDLFEQRNGRIFPSDHALMIEPFRTIWYADTTEDKGHAEKVFRYIELCCSPKLSNIFYSYDEDIRSFKVRKSIWGDENKTITDFMLNGCIEYKRLLEEASPGYSWLLACEKAAGELKTFLNDLNMKLTTNSGAMLIKPKEVAVAIKELSGLIKELRGVRATVHQELVEEAKTRNQRKIGRYERSRNG